MLSPESLALIDAEVAKYPADQKQSAVMGALSSIVSYGWPDDQVVREQERIKNMTLEQVREAATALDVDALTWVVVGDLEQIEPQVRALELGEVVVLDADGRPL